MKQPSVAQLPVFDLHCDLLAYLLEVPRADAAGTDDMGATIPYLQQGGVKLQVMAIYTAAFSMAAIVPILPPVISCCRCSFRLTGSR